MAVSPVKLTLLVGGSALITLAYIGGLAASVQAFGGGAGIIAIGAVYLGAAAIAAASPTPGGLGAIEAALVAGLTGIGVARGPRSLRSSPTGWPPTGFPSSPAGPPGGCCKGKTTYNVPAKEIPIVSPFALPRSLSRFNRRWLISKCQ